MMNERRDEEERGVAMNRWKWMSVYKSSAVRVVSYVNNRKQLGYADYAAQSGVKLLMQLLACLLF